MYFRKNKNECLTKGKLRGVEILNISNIHLMYLPSRITIVINEYVYSCAK